MMDPLAAIFESQLSRHHLLCSTYLKNATHGIRKYASQGGKEGGKAGKTNAELFKWLQQPVVFVPKFAATLQTH